MGKKTIVTKNPKNPRLKTWFYNVFIKNLRTRGDFIKKVNWLITTDKNILEKYLDKNKIAYDEIEIKQAEDSEIENKEVER